MGESSLTPSPERLDALRSRIFEGLETCLRERGYAATTVADVVAAAGTSKRSFYALYEHKGACLVDHCRRRNDETIALMADRVAAVPDPTVEVTVRAGVRAFVETLALDPAVARAHLLEIYGLGEEGIATRRQVRRSYAAAIQAMARHPRDGIVALALDDDRAMAIVGGLDELAMQAVEQARPEALEQAVEAAVTFIRAAFRDLPRADPS